MGSCESKPEQSAELVCEANAQEEDRAPAAPAGEEPATADTDQAEEPTPEALPKLTVGIVSARGLRDADWIPGAGKSDCHCVLKVVGKDTELHRTQAISDTSAPVWEEEVDVTEYLAGESLELSVWDADVADTANLLGRVKLDSSAFESAGFNGELLLEEAGKGITAFLKVKVRWPGQEYPEEREPALTIGIVGARGLRNADWMPGSGKSDCYCVLKAAGKDAQLHRTQVMNNTLEPVWNEEAKVMDYAESDALELTVYDSDLGKSDDLLGKVRLESSAFASGFNGELRLEEAGKGIMAYLRLKVKKAGQEYPPGPPCEFTIKMERDPKKKLGLDLDSQDGIYAYVNEVKAGPFQEYNKTAKATEQLKPGDFIVKVNGEEGTAKKLIDEMTAATALEILVRRSGEFRVAMDKKDPKKQWGLEFVKKPTGSALLVTGLAEGAFREWSEAHASQAVKAGDRLVAVGSYRGKAAELAKKLAAAGKAGKVQVTIARPAVPEEPSSWWFW